MSTEKEILAEKRKRVAELRRNHFKLKQMDIHELDTLLMWIGANKARIEGY